MCGNFVVDMATEKSKKALLKSRALELFLHTDFTQGEIAEMCGVHEKTISTWAIAGEWKNLRAAAQVTSAKIIQNLYAKIYDGTKKDAETPLTSDDISKLSVAIERLKDTKVSVSALTNSFKEFTSHLMSIDAELAKKVVVHQQEFLRNYIQRAH